MPRLPWVADGRRAATGHARQGRQRPARVASRDARGPRRSRPGPADGRRGATDLPDEHVRAGRRRPAARRLGVRAHRQPDAQSPRGGRGRARGRGARDRVRERLGDDRGDRGAAAARGGGRHRRRRLRRHVPPLRPRPRGPRDRRALHRPRDRSGRRARAAANGPDRADADGLARDPVEPVAEGRGCARDRGCRARPSRSTRRAADRRRGQHVRLAARPAAAHARRGHQLPLRDEVPRRPLGHDRRRARDRPRRPGGAAPLPPERDRRGARPVRLLPHPARIRTLADPDGPPLRERPARRRRPGCPR